eukprot:12333637-Ditylum_brightwellii.AAC.1
MYVGRREVFLGYCSMTSGYGLLRGIKTVGNQLRKLVGGLRKFRNGIFFVFGREISCSSMLDLSSYRFDQLDLFSGGVLWRGFVAARVTL